MKKSLLAAVAALAIVGCTQNEEIEKVGSKAEINFGAVVNNATRAAIVTNDGFKSFEVFGYKTATKIAADVSLEGFMPGVTVEKQGDNGGWGYTTGPYYWPLDGFVQFFATSPSQSLNVASGYPNFEYTVGTIDKQEDLLAANLIDKQKGENALQMPFCHLLTQVNFSIKGESDFTYTLTKLELIGLADKGTFTFNGASTAGTWTTEKLETPTEYIYTGSFDLVSNGTNTVDLDTEHSALFMLLPQTIAANAVTVRVTYSAKTTTDGQLTLNGGVKEVSLPAVTWEKGKRVRYTLNLTSDATQVTFGEPAWTDWSDSEPQPDPVTPE